MLAQKGPHLSPRSSAVLKLSSQSGPDGVGVGGGVAVCPLGYTTYIHVCGDLRSLQRTPLGGRQDR